MKIRATISFMVEQPGCRDLGCVYGDGLGTLERPNFKSTNHTPRCSSFVMKPSVTR